MKQALSNSWKLLTSKLHQPLPLNHRESQKLLSLLNESFKRNFDRQHPPGLADSEHSPDNHFNALLKSPLFGNKKTRYPSIPTKSARNSQDAISVREFMFAAKEPITYFEQQVATGTANMKSAKFALDSQTKKALMSASTDVKDNMKSSGIGSVMVNWIWSSGQYDTLDFLRDRDFVAQLMPFLVLEGLYKPIWDWLQRSRTVSVSRTPTHEAWTSLHKDIGTMVKHLVRSETDYGQGIQSAMQLFLTNFRALRLSMPDASFTTMYMNNLPAGDYLITKWAAEDAKTSLETTVIDNFDLTIESWASPGQSSLFKALLQLLHPQKPNKPAVTQLIAGLQVSETKLSSKVRIAVVRIALSAIEVLLRQNSIKEAAQIMKVVQTLFPSDVGTPGRSHNLEKLSEEEALRSLDMILAT